MISMMIMMVVVFDDDDDHYLSFLVGTFDLAYAACVPDIVIMAPSDEVRNNGIKSKRHIISMRNCLKDILLVWGIV